MFSLEKAVSFVTMHGSEIEIARLNMILGRKFDQMEILGEISKFQNADGGFSLLQDGQSKLSDTGFILTWLSDLSLLSHEITRNCFAFLIDQQGENGSWQEISDESDRQVPEWKNPANPKSILFQTANTVFWLYQFDRYSESSRNGIAFLENNYTPENAYLHTKWLWAAILSKKYSWEHQTVKTLLGEILGNPSDDLHPCGPGCSGRSLFTASPEKQQV